MKDLIQNIKKSEGFVGHVYQDSLGIDTIGFGTKMPLSEAEAELLLEHRLNQKKAELINHAPFITNLSEKRQAVLFEMAYQMGVGGVMKFKNMWSALKKSDFKKASVEMLDSRWAKQTPNRAKKLSLEMLQG